MQRLGLTGSIATGKSTVLTIICDLGVPTFAADDAVHDLYRGEAVPVVEALFPGVSHNGAIDRGRLAAQLIVHLPGRPALVPAVGHVIDGAPVRQVRGHRPPLDALLDQVADRVHVIAAAPLRGAAAPAGPPGRSRQRRLDDLPFPIAHVRRVPRHPRAAADPARAAPARHRPDSRAHSLGLRGSPHCS